VLRFGGEPFTVDFPAFRREVGRLEAAGGGDIPESSLDALVLAARQPFREGAAKAVILVTDAGPQIPDREIESVAQAADALRGKVDQLHLVVMDQNQGVYEQLRAGAGAAGETFSLAEAAGGSAGFGTILGQLGEKINVLQSGGGAVVQGSAWRVYLMYAAWTGLLGVGVALALTAAQNLEVQRSLVTPGEVGGGLVGGFAAGALASLAGQLLFGLLAGAGGGWLLAGLGRLAGWTLLGAALGFGMSFVVPNLDRQRAALGGAVGGAIGALASLLSESAGDTVSRLLGAAALGFCIGLMVALADVAFRHAWLDVSFGGKERSSVTLGATPVTLGSGRGCTVWVAGAAPVALRYVMQGEQIVCEDVPAGVSGPVSAGQSRQVGKVTATVRTSTSPAGAATGGAMVIPTAPPPPPARKPPAPPTRPAAATPVATPRPAATAPTPPRPAAKPATTGGADRGPRLPPPPPPPKPK
jgi:Ca-activated chloride channel family protein